MYMYALDVGIGLENFYKDRNLLFFVLTQMFVLGSYGLTFKFLILFDPVKKIYFLLKTIMIYRTTKIKKVENKILGIFDSVKIMTDDALSCVFSFWNGQWKK